MNRKIRILLYIVVFLFVITISHNIYAETLSIKDMKIEAKVQSNGSMNITETITYYMSGAFNGTYRDVLIKGEYGASNIVVNSVKVDNKYYLYDSYTLSNGIDGKYNINDISGGKQIKVFMPSSNETRVVELNYTLYDVVTVYNDIAQLYWNFIGDGWDSGIDNVDITIELPGDTGGDLRIYGHGPLNGDSKIIDNKTVSLKISNLSANTPIDARLLFPTNLVVTTKKVNEEKLSEILTEEQNLADEVNKKRTFFKKIVYVIYLIWGAAFIAPIIIYSRFKKGIHKPLFTGEYYRELPEDYGPAIMNKCMSGRHSSTNRYDMIATLLDLVRRKYITIEEYEIKKFLKDKKGYRLKLINTDFNNLNEQEEFFVTQIIFTDNKTETTLEEIKKENEATTTTQTKAYNNYIKWTKKIKNVAVSKDVLLYKSKLKTKSQIFMWPTLIIGMISLIFCYESILFFVAGIVLIIEYLIIQGNINDKYKHTTEKGIEHKAMWLAFKRFLLDFSNMQDYDEKSLILWEHYLVYATGLGIANKVIKNLKIKYPTEFNESNINTNMAVLYLCANTNTFNSFNSSFNSFANTAYSNPSSGSGSGGGFSGGGGGGRRRRWRRRLLKQIANYKRYLINELNTFLIFYKKLHLRVNIKFKLSIEK